MSNGKRIRRENFCGPVAGRNAASAAPERTHRDTDTAMKTYLLACGCGAAAEVGVGQAGGRVVCPRCGAALAVPRLGELVRLPAATVAPPAGHPWTAAHACLLGGTCAAALALATAWYLRTDPQLVFDPAAIRRAVAAAATTDVHKAWQALARAGVARAASPDEERLAQASRTARAVSIVLLAAAAAGAAVALGGGMAWARGRSSRP